MMSPWLAALLACVAGAALEGLLAGTDANKVMAAYRQPRWAPPPWAWYLIGVAYYAACFLAVYRLMLLDPARRWPALALVIAVMATNALWNYLFFRLKDLFLCYVYDFVYAPLVAAMMWQLMVADWKAAILFWIYVAYLPYAFSLGHAWWKLNPRPR